MLGNQNTYINSRKLYFILHQVMQNLNFTEHVDVTQVSDRSWMPNVYTTSQSVCTAGYFYSYRDLTVLGTSHRKSETEQM